MCNILRLSVGAYNNNNNNQVFYSQTSWGRLEMKPHEPKKVQNKSEKEGKTKGDKKIKSKKEKKQ
jgi:hypothetical protein